MKLDLAKALPIRKAETNMIELDNGQFLIETVVVERKIVDEAPTFMRLAGGQKEGDPC